jgi:hypothetical protein
MTSTTKLIVTTGIAVAAVTLLVSTAASKASAADLAPTLNKGAVALADDDNDKTRDDVKDSDHKKPKTKHNPKDDDDDDQGEDKDKGGK